MAKAKVKRDKQVVELVDKKANKVYRYEPYGEKRMTASEREAFVTLAGIKHYFISGDLDVLFERAGLYEHCRRDLALIKSLICKTFFELLSTVPREQVDSLCRTVDMSTIQIGVKMVSNYQRKLNDGFGLVVSYTELNTLIQNAQQQCMLCERDKCSENKCELKRTFDNIGCDADHSRGCEYRWKWNEVDK